MIGLSGVTIACANVRAVDRNCRRAERAGFRLRAPQRSKAQAGVGKIRNAVARCHNFFAQFGRIFRRFDRSARYYLGWLELAVCIILLRSGFVS